MINKKLSAPRSYVRDSVYLLELDLLFFLCDVC